MALLVGAGTSSGILMNREDARDNRASDNQVSQYKMVDTGASPEPSATTEAASPKLKKKKKAKSPSPSTSKPATNAPAKPKPPQNPSPGNGLPAGFRTVVDDRGFSLAVMKGWDRRELSPTQVGYMPPTGDEYLQISEVQGAPKASFINYLETEQAIQESNDYERISLSHVEYQGHPGARWEFIYTPESGEQMHVLQQAYIDNAGTEYTIYVEARHRLWGSGTEQVFSTALNTWKQP